jgi:arginase
VNEENKKMKVKVIQVPYDSGHRGLRAGSGPEHFLDNGLTQVLQGAGHEVSVETVESQATFRAEVQTQFELYRALADRVAEARRNDKFPLILSGNCGATLGAIGGAETKRLGIIWFDSHGEFNTPETTLSGFLDGMGLAIATGLCWKRLAASIPGFRPIPSSNILLIGGRDFDEGERDRLEQSGVIVVDDATFEQTSVQNALYSGISKLVRDVDEIHLHIDPDALNPKEAPANSYQFLSEGGMSVEQLNEAITLIQKTLNITSATVASFEPSYDPQGKTLNALLKLITQVIGQDRLKLSAYR